jgi:hypothetical protein
MATIRYHATLGMIANRCHTQIVAECPFGAGRVVLNSLNLVDNIGKVPAADRLLLNLIIYAARGADKPISDLPADFNDQLRTMGFA